jgi:hypothetical protein
MPVSDENLLDEKSLIQIDATVIAGVLILLTLTSIESDVPKISQGYTFFTGSFIVASIIPFCLPALFILLHPHKRYHRLAAVTTSLGFAS